MNKFDLTKVRPQWLVALLALALTFVLTASGCADGAADDAADAANNGQTTATEQQEQQQSSQAPEADALNVTVAIDMPDNGMAESSVTNVAIPQGGTAYDALKASGATVQDEDGDYGKFITAINGVENGSEGSASGWVFTVNDEQVTVSCDECTLAEGDTVTWSFYVG